MLNKIIVGVQISGAAPSGSLLWATRYAVPSPLSNPNVTISSIAAETYVRGSDWKYTFLCKGCLSQTQNDPGHGSSGGQTTFGYGYVSIGGCNSDNIESFLTTK
jgi:Cytochrome domain of cellobiose dehydrogenase